ncbi:Hypothetical protein A7982_03802 [Minicystis rosea]|nr:Hypothetical protein A7982_03802 [Minicystis rosea]
MGHAAEPPLGDGKQSEAPAATPTGLRALQVIAVAAAIAHLAARVSFAHTGRFFACEDDAYRSYLSFLIAQGGDLIGRFWLPGHLVAMAFVQRLGVPVAWAGIAVGTLAVVGLAVGLADVARSLAPADLRPAAPWAALLLVAASPLTLVLGHSSLAETLECALLMLGAAGILRRIRGGSRRMLIGGALALLAATWIRYEAWAVVLMLPGVLYLVQRRAGCDMRTAGTDALVSALPALGPLAWLACQAIVYKDPFAFIDQIDTMSTALTGEPSSVRVAIDRAGALLRWAPATLAWSAVAAWALRDRRETRTGALLLVGVATFGIVIEVASGREHGVFTARLAYGIEIALWPLAALGIASVVMRRPAIAAALAIATAAVLVVGVRRPPEIMDRASPTAGLLLRRGGLEATLGPGVLMVERVPERPPFGWAALGVLWSRWDRTVWATRRVNRWELVEPLDVRGRATVKPDALPTWMDRHRVTAAWILTPNSMAQIAEAWPKAKVVRIGAGSLVVKE